MASDGRVADVVAASGSVDTNAKLWLQDMADPLDMESSLAEAGIGHR